ncbi:unnamed protein product, partial [Anisakis simplex]|uniref:Uncharacterized protein n=1 Tax=Anisakis simplex TaxID=6269 RepID=A0A0M3KJ97_ANISI
MRSRRGLGPYESVVHSARAYVCIVVRERARVRSPQSKKVPINNSDYEGTSGKLPVVWTSTGPVRNLRASVCSCRWLVISPHMSVFIRQIHVFITYDIPRGTVAPSGTPFPVHWDSSPPPLYFPTFCR